MNTEPAMNITVSPQDNSPHALPGITSQFDRRLVQSGKDSLCPFDEFVLKMTTPEKDNVLLKTTVKANKQEKNVEDHKAPKLSNKKVWFSKENDLFEFDPFSEIGCEVVDTKIPDATCILREEDNVGNATIPASTSHMEPQCATVLIQRMMRGWWQRLQYNYTVLSLKLKYRDKITQRSLKKIQQDLKWQKSSLDQMAEDRLLQATTFQTKSIIEVIRSENSELIEDNKAWQEALDTIKDQNKKIEESIGSRLERTDHLKKQFQEIEKSNNHLCSVLDAYKKIVEEVEDELKQQQQICEVEHAIRLKFSNVVDKMMDRCSHYRDENGGIAKIARQVFRWEKEAKCLLLPDFM